MDEHEDAIVVIVIDSTKVERGLYLALEVMERGYRVVIALNMWDDAEKHNLSIDVKRLEELLGVPVVPTVAISGKGISALADKIPSASRVDIEGLKERISNL